MAKFTSLAVLLFVACLFVVSYATPITDISSTSIAVTETSTSPTSDRFAVTVKRVDDLVDDDGSVVAERISAVIINYDLKDDELLVNSVPVQLGIKSVQVIEAQIIPPGLDANDYEKYAENFDIGLVTVEVSSFAESFPTEDEGILLRRITIATRIIEIDGENVIQTEAVERIFEAKLLEVADGDQDMPVHYTPYPIEESVEDNVTDTNDKTTPTRRPCRFNSFASRIRHWWRCTSRFTRIVLTSLTLTALFGIFFMAIPAAVQASITAARRRDSRYESVNLEDNETVEQVIFIADDEKRALMESEKELQQ